jgi:predicted aspartyl protease
MARIPYAADHEPPCPVLTLRVAAPPGSAGIGLVAVVDTGADMTLIPESVARLLGLPVISQIRVAGVTGIAEGADVFAAAIELADKKLLVEVVALGEESIVGRDLLNRFVLRLDGPADLLQIGAARRVCRHHRKRPP